MSGKPLRICFVAPLANVLFDDTSGSIYGGSEIRAWSFAQGLGRLREFEVSMIVQGAAGRSMRRSNVDIRWHDFNGAGRVPRGLARILKHFDPMPGRDIAALLRQIDPQIVAAFGAVGFNAMLGGVARRQARKMALFLGSDIDLAGTLADVSAGRSLADLPPREEARAALLGADLIVAQTEWQARRAAALTGRPCPVVRNPIELRAGGLTDWADREGVLWIGKTDSIKRPMLAIEIARRCPEIRFRIVANPTSPGAWSEISQATPPNVELLSRFSYGDEESFYGRARVLLNTSSFEGFPNAFLQAGRFGVPIVSAAADPDGFLQRTGSGIVASSDPERLADAIRSFVRDQAQWEVCSKAIRKYVEQHEISARVADLAGFLVDLSRRGGTIPVNTVSA